MIILIVLLTTQNCVWIKLKTELQTVSSQLIHEKTEQIQKISYVALKECQSGFPTCRLIVEQHTSAAKVLVKSFQETVRSVREFPENFEYYHFHIGWLKERTGWLGYTGLFLALLATSGPDDFALMPYRWASDHPFAREAMWIVAVRLAAVALLAVLVAVHGTLTEWVVTISLGRLGLFYLFEWITILFAITWRGGDS